MVNGVSSNNTINWYQLLNAQKKTSSSNTASSTDTDSVTLSQMLSGTAGGSQKQDPLTQLVNDGTITSDQASAIGQALQSAMQSGQTPDSGTDPLASLVSAGTITQDQADSVKSTLQANRPGQGGSDFMSNVLDNLVSSGTITQDQEDSVKQAMMQGHHHAHSASATQGSSDSSSSSSSTSSTTDLSGLTADEILQMLSAGKITTQQADTALKKLEEEASSGSSSTSGTSSTTSSSSSTSAAGSRSNPLDSLVSNGTITQDQEDAIRTAFQQAANARKAMAAYSAGADSQYAGGVSV